MAWAIEQFGAWWAAPKLALAALLCWLLVKTMPRRWPSVSLSTDAALVLVNNLIVITGQS
jgi:hypothetical protein